jgi:hypothetical protein
LARLRFCSTSTPIPTSLPTTTCSLPYVALVHACGNITHLPFCTAYFTQLCYNVCNVTSKPALVGRKLVHIDLALQGTSCTNLLHKEKKLLICGIIGFLVLVGALISSLCIPPLSSTSSLSVYIRRRRTDFVALCNDTQPGSTFRDPFSMAVLSVAT